MELNLLVLRAEDPDGLVAFYEALGLRFTHEQHDRGPPHFSCRTGGIILEIYPSKGAATTISTRIGFLVDNVVESCASATRMGAILRSGPSGGPAPHAVIEDPAGHKIELVQKDAAATHDAAGGPKA